MMKKCVLIKLTKTMNRTSAIGLPTKEVNRYPQTYYNASGEPTTDMVILKTWR